MPAKWKWYACREGERDECAFESDTREEAIAAISKDEGPGVVIEVGEAQMSTARKFEGDSPVPFVRMRNWETVELGPRPTAPGEPT